MVIHAVLLIEAPLSMAISPAGPVARSISDLVRREVNPFDPTTFKPGNFWHDRPDPALTVAAIHQDVMEDIIAQLLAVQQDQMTRTLLVSGESGAGKSHLLGRLQRRLNGQAFFVYIGPWPDSLYLWRHILRNTVDSLLEVPDGENQTQLLLWLEGLLQIQDRDFGRRVFGKRRHFVRQLCNAYPKGIYNPHEFFGVLYDLTDPDLSYLATSWLRGDNLDEESCEMLRVRQPIDSEDAAQKILGNFGKITAVNQPIVLCFDNLDNLPHLPTGQPDFQSLFNVNSSIHNDKLRNFLLIISVVTNTWKVNRPLVQPADLARIHGELQVRPISLEQAQALWSSRLAPYHQRSQPTPMSPLEPLSSDWLEEAFPSGRCLPRSVLALGQQLIDRFKQQGTLPPPQPLLADSIPNPQGLHDAFALVWHHELRKTQGEMTQIDQLSSPDLIWRLREILEAVGVAPVKIPFLDRTKFSAYSLTYDLSSGETVGLLWTEDANLGSFFYVMQACEKTLETRPCQRLYLLRNANLGHASSKANQRFWQIFSQPFATHIRPTLEDVQILETYHRLVNAVCGRELMVGTHVPDLPQLQAMMRGMAVFQGWGLLQQLGIVEPGTATAGVLLGEAPGERSSASSPQLPQALPEQLPEQLPGQLTSPLPEELPTVLPTALPTELPTALPTVLPTALPGALPARSPEELPEVLPTALPGQLPGQLTPPSPSQAPEKPIEPSPKPSKQRSQPDRAYSQQAQAYLQNLMATQKLMGLQALVEQGEQQFPRLSRGQLQTLIQQLCKAGTIQRLNPDAAMEEQLLCWGDRPGKPTT